MPGITGIIGKASRTDQSNACELMLNCLLHESFYTHGSWVNDLPWLWVGWASHRGSFSDCLPIWNENRDICLIFSGEEFSDAEVLESLRAGGHQFDCGNASYLVHLYEEKGAGFLADLNGSFCGLLVDLREKKLILFNDRFGINRVYYCESGDGFYFSSEAKSLLNILPCCRGLDPKGLAEFFSCGCVLQNRTLFRGISLLPPGSAWTFIPGRPVQKLTYFAISTWENQQPLNAVEYYEQFKQTWKQVLPRYFRGKDRIALSLTGGVDSRMILAWSPCAAETLSCYTFGGRYRNCADVDISREAARICQLRHEVITVGSEFLSRFPALAEKAVYVSDGSMDVTGSIDLYVQELARQIAPVRVTGTNGGEMLRSLVVFEPKPICHGMLEPQMARLSREVALTYEQELEGRRLSFAAFKQAPWFMASKFALEKSLVTLRMPYFDNDLTALVYRAPAELIANNDISRRLINDGNPALGRIATDLGGSTESNPLIAQWRRQIQKLTFKAEYAYDCGMPQWLAKLDHALAPLHLEKIFLGRHKIHHFRLFYRDELASYVKQILLDPRASGRSYLRNGYLPEIVNGHLNGTRNHTIEIHRFLTLELIQRKLIDRN